MDAITLQVPMNKDLRDKATKMAKEEGFSSLQELIRVFLTQFVKNKLILNPIRGNKLGSKVVR